METTKNSKLLGIVNKLEKINNILIEKVCYNDYYVRFKIERDVYFIFVENEETQHQLIIGKLCVPFKNLEIKNKSYIKFIDENNVWVAGIHKI